MMDEIGAKESENVALEQKNDWMESKMWEAEKKFKQAEKIAMEFLRSRGISASDAFATIGEMG
jgi:hypothetical protein